MSSMKIALFGLAVFTLSGCSPNFYFNDNVSGEDYSDLSACGDFPKTLGDNETTTLYFVCRDTSTGECYYKMFYEEQTPACDPECYKQDTYDSNGTTIEKAAHFSIGLSEKCSMTEQDYFESKVNP